MSEQEVSLLKAFESEATHAHAPPYLSLKEYLCDGKLVAWNGPCQYVKSCMCKPPAKPDAQPEQIVIGEYPLLSANESKSILAAAVAAYNRGTGAWPTSSVEERIGCVEKFAHMMLEKREEVVTLMTWEIGKNRGDSEKEFDRTVDYIRDTIEAMKKLDRESSRMTIESGIMAQIRRAPMGVVLCMGPYNYPLNETFTTLIPALITGNVVIFKPPKVGVLLHAPLLRAFADSFPRGVINTLFGEGQTVIEPLMRSGDISVLAFIGSDRVADILRSQHPKPHRMRCVLGLGAKNPAIVLPDADIPQAVRECTLGSLSFNGQRCTALKILFVHEAVSAEFLPKLCDAVSKLKFGPPCDKTSELTPLPAVSMIDYQQALIDDAVKKGAKVMNKDGGRRYGTFMVPAVVFPVTPGMRLYSEEQFGPVVPVCTFSDVQAPLDFLVGSSYGQQCSVFTNGDGNLSALGKLLDTLVNQVCRVNINSQCQRGPDVFPFTGRKDSAEGTLSVSDALRVFTIRTLVAAKATDLNKRMVRTILRERKSAFLSTDFIL